MSSTSHYRVQQFLFKTGDLVLVKWHDGMVYFAKIKKIDRKRNKCQVVFDDKSQDEALFSQIHSVDETTTDIICIKCKKDDSEFPNEIVLCDTCGIGYHQKCHSPNIPANALNLDTPWKCVYCLHGDKCPFLTESLDVLQNLLSEESHSESEGEAVTTSRGTRRSKRGLRSSKSPAFERKKSPLLYSEVRKPNSSPINQPLLSVPEVFTPESTPETTSNFLSEKKRKKKQLHKKRHKRMSVNTQTLSVTNSEADIVFANQEKRPRNLRISWSIDETESGVKIKTPVITSPIVEDAFQSPLNMELPQESPLTLENQFQDTPSETATSKPVVVQASALLTQPSEQIPKSPPAKSPSATLEDLTSPMDCSEDQFESHEAIHAPSPIAATSPMATTSPIAMATTSPIAATSPMATTSPIAATSPMATTSPIAVVATSIKASEPAMFTVTPLPTSSQENISNRNCKSLPDATQKPLPDATHKCPPAATPKLVKKAPQHKSVDIPDFDSFDDLFDIPAGATIKSKTAPSPATTPKEALESSTEKSISDVKSTKELPTQVAVIKMVTKGEVAPTTYKHHNGIPPTAKVKDQDRSQKVTHDVSNKLHAVGRKLSTPSVEQATTILASTVGKTSAIKTKASASPVATTIPCKRALPDDVVITGVGKASPPAPKRLCNEPVNTILNPRSRTAVIPTASAYSPLVDKSQLVCYVSTHGGKPVYLPAGILPKAHRHKELVTYPNLPTANTPIYYTSEIESPAHVNTTKPYAIVTALPSTGGYQQQLIQPVSTDGSILVQSPSLVEKAKPVASPPSYSAVVNEKAQENMLLSGFDSAWKQLQANGRKYKPPKVSSLSFKSRPSHSSGKSNRLYQYPGRPRQRSVHYKPPAVGKIGRYCSLCGGDATYLCSGCKTEWYCGRDCQLKSWDKHSEFCKNSEH